MARVSLIPLACPGSAWPTDRLASFRVALEEAGYSVRVEPGATTAPVTDPGFGSGLVTLAVERIRSAQGSLLVVVDLAMDYLPGDLLAVVDRLAVGDCHLVVGARRGRWFGAITQRWLGTSDLFSGLVGLTRTAAREAEESFAPVGSRVVCELLAKVDGPRVDVAVSPVRSSGRTWVPLDDVRHAKRIADERYGTLSRLMQFCFVGASGMIVDLSSYAALMALLSRTSLGGRALFRVALGQPVTAATALAGVLAIALAITWNFSLNRRLTFNDARRGSMARQFFRYVLSNLAGCAVSLAFRLLLPSTFGFFADHRLVAAVAGIIAATGISFSLARWFVFNTRSPGTRSEPALLAVTTPLSGK